MRWLVVLMSVMCAASVRASVTETIDLDKRLDRKVTIEVIHTKLVDVAAELTKQTGITIKAGTSVKDWKPRERKVTIQAKDVPARDLIKEIARLLGFQLAANGEENKWSYTFWQDRKSRLEEDEATAAQRKAKEEQHRKMLQDTLDAADKALAMTPAEALQKQGESPFLAYLGGTPSGRGMAHVLSYIGSSCPTCRDRFFAGKAFQLTSAELPPEILRAATEAAKGPLVQFGNGGGQVEEIPDVTEIRFDPAQDQDALFIVGELQFLSMDPAAAEGDSASDIGSAPLAAADSFGGRFIGEIAMALENGANPEEKMNEIEADTEKPDFAAKFFDRESPTEKNPPTDPELTREIEIKEFREGVDQSFNPTCGAEEVGLVLKEVARATGRPVLFESFEELANFTALIHTGKQPFYKVLIALEKCGYLWEKGDASLRVRPEDWAYQRALEISESLVAYYKRLYEKQHSLTLDDHAALVTSLTDEQLIKTLPNTDMGGIVAYEISDESSHEVRDILRLYGSLSPAQKAALVSESGLQSGQLTPEQLQRLNAIIADQLEGVRPDHATIHLDPTQLEEMGVFAIAVFEKQDAEPQVIDISLYLPSDIPPEDEGAPIEEEQP